MASAPLSLSVYRFLVIFLIFFCLTSFFFFLFFATFLWDNRVWLSNISTARKWQLLMALYICGTDVAIGGYAHFLGTTFRWRVHHRRQVLVPKYFIYFFFFYLALFPITICILWPMGWPIWKLSSFQFQNRFGQVASAANSFDYELFYERAAVWPLGQPINQPPINQGIANSRPLFVSLFVYL